MLGTVAGIVLIGMGTGRRGVFADVAQKKPGAQEKPAESPVEGAVRGFCSGQKAATHKSEAE